MLENASMLDKGEIVDLPWFYDVLGNLIENILIAHHMQGLSRKFIHNLDELLNWLACGAIT